MCRSLHRTSAHYTQFLRNVERARWKSGGLQALPFSAIVKSVSAFRARPRR